LGGETVASIVKAHAPAKEKPRDVKQDIRTLAAVTPVQPSRIGVNVYGGFMSLLFKDGSSIGASITSGPASAKKPAVLVLGSLSEGEIKDLVDSGHFVMSMQPRPAPPGAEGLKSPYLGSFNLISLRAFLVGQTIMGMRIDDTIRTIDYLSTQNVESITLYGNGAMGTVALHAAALDSRISHVVAENSLASYRMVLDQPLHRDISEIMIPGVLRKYDMSDVIQSIAPRSVTIINPKDAAGVTITEGQFREELGLPNQKIRVATRAPGDPLPLN
jgi:hypothetical protein